MLVTIIMAPAAFCDDFCSVLSSTVIEVTAATVDNVSPGDTVDITVEISPAIGTDSLLLDGLNLAIAWDSAVIQFDGVSDGGLAADNDWFFEFVLHSDSVIPTATMLLELVGAATAQSALVLTGSHYLTLRFVVAEDSILHNTSTDISFYWRDCYDNVFWSRGYDTALLAGQVLNANGIDITDTGHALPSTAGPASECSAQLSHDDTAAIVAGCFRSGRINFSVSTAVDESSDATVPNQIMLAQNYPNPFNPDTRIEFSLPCRCDWQLEVFNLMGQVVAQNRGRSGPGTMSIDWCGRDLCGQPAASGVYFYRLEADGRHFSRKMLLLR
ncbi:MAG: T9SS type A sorting domain-containing protein [bacterium]